MSDSSPSGDISYVMTEEHFPICGVGAAVRSDDVKLFSREMNPIKRIGNKVVQSSNHSTPTTSAAREKNVMAKCAYQICVTAFLLLGLGQGMTMNN